MLQTIQEDPDAEWPLTFEIATPRDLKGYCGVRSFTAPETRAYLPAQVCNFFSNAGTGG